MKKKISIIFAAVLIAVIVIYEVIALAFGIPTISAMLRGWAAVLPGVALFTGIAGGHWFIKFKKEIAIKNHIIVLSFNLMMIIFAIPPVHNFITIHMYIPFIIGIPVGGLFWQMGKKGV